jgi:hypothetical protein
MLVSDLQIAYHHRNDNNINMTSRKAGLGNVCSYPATVYESDGCHGCTPIC